MPLPSFHSFLVVLIYFVVLILNFVSNFSTFPGLADEVHSFPDVNFALNYRHYSGYLKSHNQTYLHYWFFESQSPNAPNDPVILWLNGGPGCSSLVGAVTECGPLTLNQDGNLIQNLFSWNLNANLLFLESPAGVGFSYQLEPPPNSKPNDNTTALINFEALHRFYRKFPHLTQNDLYLTGESYAGIYIPTLSMIILEQNFPTNFKGIAIGNALLDSRLMQIASIQYGYNLGMVPSATFKNIIRHCCPPNYRTLRDCSFPNLYSQNRVKTNCLTEFSDALARMFALPTNVYNVKQNCVGKKTQVYMCANRSDHLIGWFNRADVQDALKIAAPNPNQKIQWVDCNSDILKVYVQNVVTVRDMLRHLLKKNIKVLLYYGDLDLVCPYIGAEWFLDDLNLTNNSIIQFSPWHYQNHLTAYVKNYTEGLMYARIIDASHEALRDQPEAMFKIVHDFVRSTSSLSSGTNASGENIFELSKKIVLSMFILYFVLIC